MSQNGSMPAMPVECEWSGDEVVRGLQTGDATGWATGMSKRELFAAFAMQGHLANDANRSSSPELTARWSVECADALLSELAKVQ